MIKTHLITLECLYNSIAPLNAAIIAILASNKPNMQRAAFLQGIINEIIDEADQIISDYLT